MVTTLALARELPEDSADLPTDCPGWTVRDQLAHMVGLEQTFAGSTPLPCELPPLDHVKDDFTRFIAYRTGLAAMKGELGAAPAPKAVEGGTAP